MAKKPFFSVIVLNWNGKEHLETCFKSIENQSFRNFETLLVDNDSDDGSVEYVEDNFPFVRIVENDDNYGFAKGNNIGMRNALGKWFLILNNDTKLEKDFLEEAFKVIEQADEDVGMVGPKMIFFDTKKIDTIGINLLKSGLGKDAKRYNKKIVCPCGGAAFYKREMLEDIKEGRDYFDSDFFIYAEDFDLGLRALRKGWRYKYSQKSVVHHVHSATMMKTSKFALYLQQRNIKLAMVKNLPSRFWFRNLFWIVYVHVLVSGLWTLRGRLWTVIKYHWNFLKLFPKFLKKRKNWKSVGNGKIFEQVALDELY